MSKLKEFLSKAVAMADPSDLVAGASVTIKYFFSHPVTVMYPFEKREFSSCAKGVLALIPDKYGDDLCIGCMQCVKICPVDCLTVEMRKLSKEELLGRKFEEKKKKALIPTFEVDLQRCMLCSLCVEICPTDALEMSQTVTLIMTNREDQVLDRMRMLELGKDTQRYRNRLAAGEIECEAIQCPEPKHKD